MPLRKLACLRQARLALLLVPLALLLAGGCASNRIDAADGPILIAAGGPATPFDVQAGARVQVEADLDYDWAYDEWDFAYVLLYLACSFIIVLASAVPA